MNIEKLIAEICAPALAGIKPSNLVSLDKKTYENVKEQVSELNRQLNRKNIYFEIMKDTERKALVLVYRPEKLMKYIRSKEIGEFLASYGYPEDASLEAYLAFLKERLGENDFPHEIGAFLGYPIADIRGFLQSSTEGILLVGDWKVYADEEKARRTFARYNSCRNGVKRRLSAGVSLAQIFCAA